MGSDAYFALDRDYGGTGDSEYYKVEPEHGKAPTCPSCGAFLGMLRWAEPRRAALTAHGAQLGDVAFFSQSDFLISERLRLAMVDHELATGVTLSAVEIVEVKVGAAISAVGEWSWPELTHGRFVDDANSNFTWNGPPSCPVCRARGWDGVNGFALKGNGPDLDVFIPGGAAGIVVVSDRARRTFLDAGVSGCTFVPTGDYRWGRMDTGQVSEP